MKPGRHSLKFDWAGRSGVTAVSNQFEARVNGRVIKSVNPTDCDVHQENIEFELGECSTESWIEFCGNWK